MPRGASPKREREYEKLKSKFQKSGRYGQRATEVAARIVNKQRAEHGETKGETSHEKKGPSPAHKAKRSNRSSSTRKTAAAKSKR